MGEDAARERAEAAWGPLFVNDNLRWPVPHHVTAEWLRLHGACEEDRRHFALMWPDGGDVTEQTLFEALEAGLDVTWFYRTTHTAAAYDRLTRAMTKPHGDYHDASEGAWREWDRADPQDDEARRRREWAFREARAVLHREYARLIFRSLSGEDLSALGAGQLPLAPDPDDVSDDEEDEGGGDE